MRKNNFKGALEVCQAWVAITGADEKSTIHRANRMREAGIFPDFRHSGARLSVEHVAKFILAMISAEQHIDAPQAALERGALVRGSKITSSKPVSLWKATGTLQTDLEDLLLIVRDRGGWVPCTLQVSPNFAYGHMLIFSLKDEVAAHVYYGQRANSTLGPIFEPRRTIQIEAPVIEHMAKLLTDV
jgi:hypothetical protein